ncbi:MAG: transposase [Candidatus Woesearchaeota archaeon]|jgi:IS605 OrfB family transposase
MQRTIKIKLTEDNDLIDTIRIFSKARQYVNDVGFKKKIYNKNKLNKLTYKKIKKLYPNLPTGLIQTARDVASESIKREKCKRPIKVKEFSSVRLDKRNLRVNLEHKLISISSVNGRKKITFQTNRLIEKYKDWKPVAGMLCYKQKKLYLNLVVENDSPKINLGSINIERDLIGIDRGVNNILVCSNNQFFNSKNLKKIKGKYQYLKAVLQKKDTKSAKRHLKLLSGKEARFVSDTNHRLSKLIADSDFKVFVLEDLKDMKSKKNGRRFNKKLGSWSFKQFETFLKYKCEEREKLVISVNPKYTSQTCSHCGYKDKLNRKRGNFKCLECGYELHADLNASRNIAELGKSGFSRLFVNQPIVETQVSYKPTILMVGN